jgi:hypothetical protein
VHTDKTPRICTPKDRVTHVHTSKRTSTCTSTPANPVNGMQYQVEICNTTGLGKCGCQMSIDHCSSCIISKRILLVDIDTYVFSAEDIRDTHKQMHTHAHAQLHKQAQEHSSSHTSMETLLPPDLWKRMHTPRHLPKHAHITWGLAPILP